MPTALPHSTWNNYSTRAQSFPLQVTYRNQIHVLWFREILGTHTMPWLIHFFNIYTQKLLHKAPVGL